MTSAPEPILIHCEGSHARAHPYPIEGMGVCPMCGQALVTRADGTAFDHTRDTTSLLASLEVTSGDVVVAMLANSVDLVMTSPPFLALRSYRSADVLTPHGSICVEKRVGLFLDVEHHTNPEAAA